MVLLDEHIVTTQVAGSVGGQSRAGCFFLLDMQAMMFSTFKGPFEEDIDERLTQSRCARAPLSSPSFS